MRDRERERKILQSKPISCIEIYCNHIHPSCCSNGQGRVVCKGAWVRVPCKEKKKEERKQENRKRCLQGWYMAPTSLGKENWFTGPKNGSSIWVYRGISYSLFLPNDDNFLKENTKLQYFIWVSFSFLFLSFLF